ncbi:hypothetical protein KKG22_02010 [Patescibacteria group bacterium]|nr:hypothetical protein [Patescibacteria group bacterium]MBU1721872.1 hypothetical protein [Patescibacteria group bacterium]MBU1901330.1 hypothetical protein [Patescibacteria group bacterium]
MGLRKKNNQKRYQQRLIAKAKRNIKKLNRLAKAKTPGQTLHDTMHRRKEA